MTNVVLVVEDDEPVRFALTTLLRAAAIEVDEAATAEAAERRVRQGGVSLVVQDMNFERGATSGLEGMQLFRRLRALDGDLPIILLTAWVSLEAAVALTKEGAVDYLAKPWNNERLLATVRANQRLRALAGEARTAKRPIVPVGADLAGIVFESESMQRQVALALQVASEDVPVLILGPNGAGKEKFAEIVQRNSRRRDQPFVRVNVGALPDSLLEAELFGAEAGAYTGASRGRPGRFEAAHGGTLFLDEIGNLSSAGQARLLRVLQSGEFERLGSSTSRRVDVRLICATNLDVYAAIQAGTFREDLLYRINVIELRVPPLAERRADILPVARSLLEALAAERGVPPYTLTADAVRALEKHRWPGNVRELVNAVRRAVLFADGQSIEADHLGLPPSTAAGTVAANPGDTQIGGKRTARNPTAEQIRDALRRHDGRVRAAAAELGMSRQSFYRRLEWLGIDLTQYRADDDPAIDDGA